MFLGGRHSKAQASKQQLKSLKLSRDGDVWEAFENAVKMKTPSAIKITKVKAHATEQDLQDKKISQRDYEGNDKADKNADTGVQMNMVLDLSSGEVG